MPIVESAVVVVAVALGVVVCVRLREGSGCCRRCFLRFVSKYRVFDVLGVLYLLVAEPEKRVGEKG